MNRRCDAPDTHRSARGQVMILFAVSSIVLLGMLALAIDVGFLLAERRQVQAAADSGALAAAHAALLNLSAADVIAAGDEYGAQNAGVTANDVAVNRPPTSGEHAGDDDYVEVVIIKDVERFFLGAVYDGDWEVSASAVAVVEPKKVNVAMLALNPDEGGIETSGNTDISVTGGSIVSNYNIDASGNSSITADEQVNANDGFVTSGNWTIDGGQGSNPNAPEVPDPLAGNIEPPTLPAVPLNPVSTVNPGSQGCYTAPGYSGSGSLTGASGRFSGGSSCVTIENASSNPYVFSSGQYRFDSAGLRVQNTRARINGGTWNFNGGPGIRVSGNTPLFDMGNGNYSFLNGAGINISGNAGGNILGGGNYYFSGGGGIASSGNTRITLKPGTYIFNGGAGLTSSGNNGLHFAAGVYEMWFGSGADFAVSGNTGITFDPGAYLKMYFYGENNNFANMTLTGNTDFDLPSGEFYFDRGNLISTGNTHIDGEEVFFYFDDGGHVESTGNSSFAFTAQDGAVYPGHYSGVFMYSHPDNTATFKWTGNTGSMSRGIIYLPGSKVETSGNTNGVVFEGQFIADSFDTGGNTIMGIEYFEYVEAGIPTVYLVD